MTIKLSVANVDSLAFRLPGLRPGPSKAWKRIRPRPALAVVALTAVSLVVSATGWQLGLRDAAALDRERAGLAGQIDRLDAGTRAAATVGVEDADLSPIRRRIQDLRRQEPGATHPRLQEMAAQTAALSGQVLALERAQQLENAAVQASAREISARYAGRLDVMRAAGRAPLARERNDATVAAFLKIQLGRTAAATERYGAMLGSADPSQVALGVAGTERYSPLAHNALVAHLPARVIVVSLASQRLQAFDHGHPVAETLVTTGRPALPTDVGRMQVVKKSSPWTMQSPWPKGSDFWYPDTKVAMVLWFTNTGEGIHDADWEPASAFGPGSPAGPFASHGCIHVPADVMRVLYQWAPLNTPVVVIPGDGAPVATQTAQQSVDALGRPLGSVPSGI
ncbi:MAG: L,D-transpeptidase [Candidatus Dormibacter sp.]